MPFNETGDDTYRIYRNLTPYDDSIEDLESELRLRAACDLLLADLIRYSNGAPGYPSTELPRRLVRQLRPWDGSPQQRPVPG